MDPATKYLSLEPPNKSSHLWKYTPWNRVHPTGKLDSIPQMGTPKMSISSIDGTHTPDGIRLVEGIMAETDSDVGDELTHSFLDASSKNSKWTLKIEDGFTSESPILLNIEAEGKFDVVHISLDVGIQANFELVTRVVGECEWFGILRTGHIGDGAILNDVLMGLQEEGAMLRSDSITLGRDVHVRAGTVSSGSERTKADLRYRLSSPGGSVRVLGSILSAESMHLDHHIEIHHEAPETFSRLSWHSACGGKSRTVGTGMLRVKEGSKGADAAQIFHNLLLSDGAEADSIPELEVMESDVVGCGHGTANGPIDEEQEFYLQARGFDKQDARRALIAAFLNSTLSEMGGASLHEWLVGALAKELESLDS